MTDVARDHLERMIASACRLAGRNAAVRSVSVVGGRRLAAAELMRSQERADACGARLTMDAAGVVTIRRCSRLGVDPGPPPRCRDRHPLLLPHASPSQGGPARGEASGSG